MSRISYWKLWTILSIQLQKPTYVSLHRVSSATKCKQPAVDGFMFHDEGSSTSIAWIAFASRRMRCRPLAHRFLVSCGRHLRFDCFMNARWFMNSALNLFNLTPREADRKSSFHFQKPIKRTCHKFINFWMMSAKISWSLAWNLINFLLRKRRRSSHATEMLQWAPLCSSLVTELLSLRKRGKSAKTRNNAADNATMSIMLIY